MPLPGESKSRSIPPSTITWNEWGAAMPHGTSPRQQCVARARLLAGPALQLVDGIGGHALLCTRNVCNARWSSSPPPCGCRIHRPWSDVDSRAACVGRQSVRYAFPARPRVRSWSWLRRPRACLCRGKGQAGAGAIWLRSSGDDAGHSGSESPRVL
jgi:hypothetical protein